MLEELKQRVFKANLELLKNGLVIHTWGNVSGKDSKTGYIVIKPSGVSYADMKMEDMVVMDPDGKVVEGRFRPSTDTPTHLVLYKQYPSIGGVVHTHSTYATSWAQSGRSIPAFGTTHADHYHGAVPCTRRLTDKEIMLDYELNTGLVIIETLGRIDPLEVPSALVHSHGPFAWGDSPEKAVYNAIALEEIALMAFNTILLGRTNPVEDALLEKHYGRKHGKDAYYGQK